MRKIAQVGLDLSLADLFSGFRGLFIRQEQSFKNSLADYLFSEYLYLLNSGTAAFYLILETLKDISSKREVVLPAYTAPAIVLPILKAGLKPVICDISLEDFNLDLNLLPQAITKDTLCIVPTHMFGIVTPGVENLKEKIPQGYIVEDCCQSMGSKISGKPTGSFGDLAFSSFNRGKNLPTYGGGCIFSNSSELAKKIEGRIDKLREQGIFLKFGLPFKITVFSLIVQPAIYGALHTLVSQFKDNRLHDDFSIGRYTDPQAGFGLALLKKIEASAEKRYQNGLALLKGLSGVEGIILPGISADTKPVFNRFPLVFKDLKLRDKAEEALVKSGIDISRMYLKPLHHIFDLGYNQEEFPNAGYFAGRLLTLPVHPLVGSKDLLKIIEVIRKVCSPSGI